MDEASEPIRWDQVKIDEINYMSEEPPAQQSLFLDAQRSTTLSFQIDDKEISADPLNQNDFDARSFLIKTHKDVSYEGMKVNFFFFFFQNEKF